MNNYQIAQELNNSEISEYDISDAEAKLETVMNRLSDTVSDKEDFVKRVNKSKAAKNIISLIGEKYGKMVINDNVSYYNF